MFAFRLAKAASIACVERLHLGQELGQLGMGLLLLVQVRQHLVPEGHVLVDPAADVLDEDHDLDQDPLDLGPPLLLLLGGVDGLQRVAGGAGRAALASSAPWPSTSRMYSQGPTPSVARTTSTTVNWSSGVVLARG